MTILVTLPRFLALGQRKGHSVGMKPLISLFLAGGLTLNAASALADVHALLVGVSDYKYLDADLRGPINDVGLMARTLLARGATEVRVLAEPTVVLPEGVAPAVVPTRAAILSGLADLAQVAGPDDTVIFYFSGHGAQAPDLNGDEAGGYDEIFLPADAKNWSGTIGAVENAIVDDEFQPLFQAILNTGATLIAIVDACHSATGFRAVSSAPGAERFISSATLGVPEDLPTPEVSGTVAPPLEGQFAFLYSSQSDQRSFEYPLGDKADLSNWYGDFTRSLAVVLAETPDLTWEQALRGATDTLQKGAAMAVQTPDGEGPALTTPVFGSTDPGARRVVFERGELKAGLLSGYGNGAVFDLYETATSTIPVARATLSQVGADKGQLIVESGEMPARGYGVQRRPGVPAPFRLSVPVLMDAADHSPILDALGGLVAAGLPEGVEWNAENPDAVIILSGGTLALTGPDGVLDPDGPGSSPRMGADPAGFFERAARVYRLRRALALAESHGPVGFSLPGAGLQQQIERVLGNPTADGCAEPVAGVGPFEADQTVTTCDRLWVSLTNTSKTAQDVTVLYVDRDFNTSVLWPEPGLSNRINFGEMQEVGLEIRTPNGLPGQEELIVLAVPAQPGAARTVLSGLADPTITRAGPGAPALQLYLELASDLTATNRNFGFTGAVAPLNITRTRLHLVPVAR
ncbi:caspase family protein [Oceaniglobus ichthyenteri]|uniref:caspase family protein n=1 Tax=Oceaniglobus ichthyenteri TaxID=2136177 RepID=UPI000D34C76E|nr:caspase family protein [Oceaniglobus ichthyenteri]